jgi:hypothetical protein
VEVVIVEVLTSVSVLKTVIETGARVSGIIDSAGVIVVKMVFVTSGGVISWVAYEVTAGSVVEVVVDSVVVNEL